MRGESLLRPGIELRFTSSTAYNVCAGLVSTCRIQFCKQRYCSYGKVTVACAAVYIHTLTQPRHYETISNDEIHISFCVNETSSSLQTILSCLDVGQMVLADTGFIGANIRDPGNDLMQAARRRSCFLQ